MKNENKIVIWDWGGVVESHYKGEYNCYGARVNTIKRLTKKMKNLDNETICKIWEECNCDEKGKYISELIKNEDIQKWFERIRKKITLECKYDEFYQVYQEETDKIVYYKDVVSFAHSLKSKCKIGILSNLTLLDKNRINKHYNLSKFDFVWLSFELGCRKPDERIYKIVEEQCKIPKENILFIDDTPANIKMAEQMGWNVCLATGLEFDKIKESVYKFLENDAIKNN